MKNMATANMLNIMNWSLQWRHFHSPSLQTYLNFTSDITNHIYKDLKLFVYVALMYMQIFTEKFLKFLCPYVHGHASTFINGDWNTPYLIKLPVVWWRNIAVPSLWEFPHHTRPTQWQVSGFLRLIFWEEKLKYM